MESVEQFELWLKTMEFSLIKKDVPGPGYSDNDYTFFIRLTDKIPLIQKEFTEEDLENIAFKSFCVNRNRSRGDSSIVKPELYIKNGILLAKGSPETVYCALCIMYGLEIQ